MVCIASGLFYRLVSLFLLGLSFNTATTAFVVQVPRNNAGIVTTRRPLVASPLLASTLAPTIVPAEEESTTRHSPIRALADLKDMVDMIENARPNQLVVITFHAHYCKVCRRVQIKYKKMALDENGSTTIAFASLETSKILPKTLRLIGVTKFPFVQIWRNAKKVASFGPGGTLFQKRVTETLQMCKNRSTQDWLDFEDEFHTHITKSQQDLKKLKAKAAPVPSNITKLTP